MQLKHHARLLLQGTVAAEKNEMLFSEFGINYNSIPARFRKVHHFSLCLALGPICWIFQRTSVTKAQEDVQIRTEGLSFMHQLEACVVLMIEYFVKRF
jgi:tRNA(His) 5'-end guanylyltransferase